LSGRYRRQLLPPEFGPSSNTQTLGEILERTPPQDLQREEMMETDGQKQYIRDMESQSTPSLFKMAATLGESIIKNHAFLDGNKRAGHLAISMFLAINGYDLDADDESPRKLR
ncbi:897_t:CDS:2, partial [Ambispora leptoticha]